MHRPGVELAIFLSRVRRPNPLHYRVSCVACCAMAGVPADLTLTTVIHSRRRRMAGDDDDDDDDADDFVTGTTTVTSPMGLPPSVMALLGRMTSYSDRMAWTVVEDACRVCLTLSWDVGERRRRQGRDGRQRSVEAAPCDGGGGAAGPCKESLWSRIRRSLHPRRSVSVDSTTAADIRRHQQHPQPSSSSHWRSRDANDERACAARERWRTVVRRHRSVSAGRPAAGDHAAAVAWRQQRQRSWNDAAELVEPSTEKDLLAPAGAVHSRRRLLPSLSLPERFLSPPPLHHHYQQQQQQQLTPQDDCLRAGLLSPQYDSSVNSVRQTQPSVS